MDYSTPTIPESAGCGAFMFRPPKTNSRLIAVAKALLPLALRFVCGIKTVEIGATDLDRLRALGGQRVILTPNHPAGPEQAVLFHLSKLLGSEFNFLAAKEAFERSAPVGWFAQRLGAYSVVRGTADRSSFRMTQQLLMDGTRWLVIFPEGEVCRHGDMIMPFQQGAAQLAFWAYEELNEKGESPPLYFVPVAIRYFCLGETQKHIEYSLSRLERELFATEIPSADNAYDRLRRIGEVVLSVNERKYNVRPRKDATLNDRVQHLKEIVLCRVAASLGASLRPERPLLERIRDLFNELDRLVYSELQGTDYERQLQQRRQQEALSLYHDLWRVLRFVALHDGYVRQTMTAERFLDVIGLLEMEILGRQVTRVPKKAVVKIGEPLNLADYFPLYRSDKRKAVQEVTSALESCVRNLVTALSETQKPIFEDNRFFPQASGDQQAI